MRTKKAGGGDNAGALLRAEHYSLSDVRNISADATQRKRHKGDKARAFRIDKEHVATP